ncbi:MAG TPA: PDZ domain-containing protein, partial [Synergistaceae bacterium]|nr:PDZ domain-containing protein [Synergistaceae bacterium]
RAWLGVYIQPLTKEFAEAYGVKEENGAVVSDVLRDSPAEKAGLQRGDVILEVDGSGVKNHQEFVMKIRQKLAGDKVTLTLIRQKKNIKVDIPLGEMPGNEKQAASRTGGSKMLTSIGLEAGEMTDDIRKQNNLRKDEGVLITAVEDGSMAQRAGIRENDVLLEVNGVRLSGLSDLDKADVKGNSVVLLIMRDSRSFFVSIRTGQ